MARLPYTVIQRPSDGRASQVVTALAASRPRVWVGLMGMRDDRLVIAPAELREEDASELECWSIDVLSRGA